MVGSLPHILEWFGGLFGKGGRMWRCEVVELKGSKQTAGGTI